MFILPVRSSRIYFSACGIFSLQYAQNFPARRKKEGLPVSCCVEVIDPLTNIVPGSYCRFAVSEPQLTAPVAHSFGNPQLSVFLARATSGSALSATACRVFVISLSVCTE